MSEHVLRETMDAAEWAKEFMLCFSENKSAIDESLMLTWFANAIMAGFDEAEQRNRQRIAQLEAEVTRVKEVRRDWRTVLTDTELSDQDYVRAYVEDFGVTIDTEINLRVKLEEEVARLTAERDHLADINNELRNR